MSLEIKNLDSVLTSMDAISQSMPFTAEKYLRKAGNELKKEAIDATPHGAERGRAVAKLNAAADDAATMQEESSLRKKASRTEKKDLASGWKGTVKGDWKGSGIS